MNDSTTQVRRYSFSERHENRMGSTTYEHMREDTNGMYVMADDLDTALAQVATNLEREKETVRQLAQAQADIVALTRERDKAKADWEALMLIPFARNFSALETERDLLRREVDGLRAGLLKARTELAGVGANSSKDFHGMCICSALRIIDAALSPASGGK